jgi:hypothetical protein
MGVQGHGEPGQWKLPQKTAQRTQIWQNNLHIKQLSGKIMICQLMSR